MTRTNDSGTLSLKGSTSIRQWIFVLFTMLLMLPIAINLVSYAVQTFSNPLSKLEINQSAAIEQMIGFDSKTGDITTDIKFLISFPDGHGVIMSIEEVWRLNLDITKLGACDSITRTGSDTYELRRTKRIPDNEA